MVGSIAGRTVDENRAAQGLDSVAKADETRATRDVGAPYAIVPDRETEGRRPVRRRATFTTVAFACFVAFVSDLRDERNRAATPMGSGSRDSATISTCNRDRGATRQRSQGRPETAFGQDRRMDAARELVKLAVSGIELVGDPV